MGETACMLCDGTSTVAVAEHGAWIVSAPTPDVIPMPGWLLVHTADHLETMDAIDDAAWVSLGLALKFARRRIAECMPVSRIYMVAFGEDVPHAHVAVVGVTDEQRSIQRGPAAFVNRTQLDDRDAAAEFVGKVQSLALS